MPKILHNAMERTHPSPRKRTKCISLRRLRRLRESTFYNHFFRRFFVFPNFIGHTTKKGKPKMAFEKNDQKKSTRGDAAGVGALYEVPEVCTRQFFRQSPLRGYTGVCKLVHSFVHEYWEDRIVRYVQKKAPRLFEVKWQGDEIRRLAHAFHSGQREYINASVRGQRSGSTLAVLLAWMLFPSKFESLFSRR